MKVKRGEENKAKEKKEKEEEKKEKERGEGRGEGRGGKEGDEKNLSFSPSIWGGTFEPVGVVGALVWCRGCNSMCMRWRNILH